MTVHDLYLGATSFKGLTGVQSPDFGGLYDVDVFRGSNKVIPGLDGETGVDLVRDAYDFPVPFHIKQPTDAELVAAIAGLRAALNASGGRYTLTRRLPQTLTPFYADTTCNGQYRGLTWTDTEDPLTAIGVVVFRNLDGAWA